MEDMQKELNLMGAKAVKAARVLAVMDSENKRKLLYAMADAIMANADKIKEANSLDMANGEKKWSDTSHA